MLPGNVITGWAVDHPWPERRQVEQDLLLSRAICELANHPYLGQELAFRGGTALHKLHTDRPYRYSEDLDYVRASADGIGPMFDALRELGESLGYEARSNLGKHPKVLWRCTSDDGIPLRIKVEVNTYERSPAMPHTTIRHQVDTQWWSGRADVKTFQAAELVSTKVRALYQRKKGRDLFDLWLAITELEIDPDRIIGAFAPYRPDGWTPRLGEQNLRNKLNDYDFVHDLDALTQDVPEGFTFESAAELIITELIKRVGSP